MDVQLLVAVSVRASTAASGVSQLNEAIPLQEMVCCLCDMTPSILMPTSECPFI